MAVLERFRKRVRDAGQLRLVRPGQWEQTSWFDVGRQSSSLAAGMHLLGVGPGDSVAIVGPTGVEGSVALIASVLLGAHVRLLEDELCLSALSALSAEERCPLIMTGSRAVVVGLESAGQKGTLPRRTIGWGGASSVPGVLPFGQLCLKGADALERDSRVLYHLASSVRFEELLLTVPRADDTTSRCQESLSYTQRNCLAATCSLVRALGIHSTDRMVSLLPVRSHLERTLIGWSALLCGATEILAEPPTGSLVELLGTSAPTVLFATGEVLDALMWEIEREFLVGSAWQRRMSAWAVRVGTEAARRRLCGAPQGALMTAGGWLADVAVLAQVRKMLGGALRAIVVWPGAMHRATRWFFEAARISPLGLFGRPESSGIGLMEPLKGPRPGSYGWPMPYTETRMDGQGMIYTRGAHVLSSAGGSAVASGESEPPWIALGLSGDRDDEGYYWPERAFGALDAPSLATLPIASNVLEERSSFRS